MSADRAGDGRIVWAAFEVRPDGAVRAALTLERNGGYERVERRWRSLAEAERELGAGFGEIVRKVLVSGSTRGRWRP